MRTPLRATIALALVITVFLVKSHLDSVLQWQTDHRINTDLYILGDAYIELVSAQTATPATASQNPTRRKWTPTARPTPRLVQANPELKRVPVDVPGAEWAGDLFFRSRGTPKSYDSLLDKLLSPVEEDDDDVVAPSSTAPARPKVTPKSDRIVVLGKMSYEDTDWLEDQLPEYVSIDQSLIANCADSNPELEF